MHTGILSGTEVEIAPECVRDMGMLQLCWEIDSKQRASTTKRKSSKIEQTACCPFAILTMSTFGIWVSI